MRIRSLGLVIVAFTLASVSLLAHHSFAMFEMDKDVEYRGVVREWKWQNPHVHFTIDVRKGPGVDPKSVGLWDVEGGSVNIMTRQGWTRASYKAGDPIRLVGHPVSLRRRASRAAGRSVSAFWLNGQQCRQGRRR